MNAASITKRATRKAKTDAATANTTGIASKGILKADTNIKAAEEKKHDERFLGISTKTLITAIENAAGFSKSALHLELAVGLMLYSQHGNTDAAAKKDLATVYQQAGYKCTKSGDEDYTTVNRRINNAAKFFTWLGGKAAINEWTIATTEMQSIQAIVRHLEDEFNLKGMNSVMATIGQPVILKRDRQKAEDKKTAEQPSEADKSLAGAMAAKSAEMEAKKGEGKTEGQQRRAEDKQTAHTIQTTHIRLAIPTDVSKEELIELSMQILEFANTIKIAA